MNSEINKLFVYGSLRSGFRTTAYHYMAKYFHLMGEATVQGRLYDQGQYPVAVPTEEERFLTGELYQLNNLSEFTWVIGQLDDYEGVNAEEGKKPVYKREIVNVLLNDRHIPAWIYWFNDTIDGFPEIESGDVLVYLNQKNKS